jgi:hypothetical protein
VELLDEVCSDMSSFHGIRNILKLRSPDFFRMAEQLHNYQGAVLHAAIAMAQAEEDAKAEAEKLTPEQIKAKLYPGWKGEGAETPEPESPVRKYEVPDEKPHTLTAEELQTLPEYGAAPGIGQFAPVFTVVKCT